MHAVYRKMARATGGAAVTRSAHVLELSYDDRKRAGKLSKMAVVFLILFN